MKYDPKDIEPKWQKYWEKKKIFEVKEYPKKKKFYGLVEFPYPSGVGLHVGHPRPFTAMDVICRKRRMDGQNVLYPMGFDAFGLPTENFAIKTGRPPKEVTAENIATFTRQLKALGYSFDWSRTVDTTDPTYYKWTQWIFLQLFKHGLAYKKKQPINWCPKDKIGLANEEVVTHSTSSGQVAVCERCGGPVEKRDKEQWMLAITKYADSLLEGLNDVDYIQRAKLQQENWIGRSEGAIVKFQIVDSESQIEVFTTRLDTIFSGTFLVLAPEHSLVSEITATGQKKIVEAYIQETVRKTDMERSNIEREKTGVFTGAYALNPATEEPMPIWIADFVLAQYGTGAVFADGHDVRDFEMAKKYNIPLKVSIRPSDNELWEKVQKLETCYPEEGILTNSGQFDGLTSKEGREKILAWLKQKGMGSKKVNFKLRDWVFSRQRYWGEPIPLVFCENCNGWIPLPESELPLKLPEVEKYQPTDTGESPLATMHEWVNVACPACGSPARRETDTMPNWAGSSWYFLRYCDPKNDKELASMEKLQYWMAVDWYNGGMEHTVLHLLYSRFWNQFLYDIGVVPTKEPYAKRTSHGIILASDGEKMSKSRGNVINPDDMIAEYGADALRTYILFMGPFDQAVNWDTNGLVGVRRFLDRIWNLQEKVDKKQSIISDQQLLTSLHQTIKKVTEDIEAMRFNTAIAKMMELTNKMYKSDRLPATYYQLLLKLLSPFAPHMTEELWQILGGKESIAFSEWPTYDPALIVSDTITIAVQVNGKLRATLDVTSDESEENIKAKALEADNVKKWLEGKELKKVIYVKGKLVSVVV